MKIALAQLNPTIGKITHNFEKIRHTLQALSDQEPDLIIFSELFLTGYPPHDLLTYPAFIQDCHQALSELIQASQTWKQTHILLGTPFEENGALYNAACLIGEGQLKHTTFKQKLPNYDVFHESRYFTPGTQTTSFQLCGQHIGVLICEDAWPQQSSRYHHPTYTKDPISVLKTQGINLAINLSASPFEQHKHGLRQDVFSSLAQELNCPVIMVNQVGANDHLIFEGRSLVVSKHGERIAQLKPFEEDIKIITSDTLLNGPTHTQTNATWSDSQNLYEALVLGIQDYAKKTGFSKAVLGLSGGIDSAVVAVLATEALGKENVLGITMPSVHSSEGSVHDSEALAQTLGIELLEIPIAPIVDTFLETLRPNLSADTYTTEGQMSIEENLQPRIRGTVLMGLSNKENRLLLNTGNKSELAVGYCTLYGDMNGALSVIGDVYKTEVYQLATFINQNRIIIPTNTLTKAPSAELKPNQKDQDTLPDYAILDKILYALIEERKTTSELYTQWPDKALINWIVNAVGKHEYKRFQAPPILKVSRHSFGYGRRMPLTSFSL